MSLKNGRISSQDWLDDPVAFFEYSRDSGYTYRLFTLAPPEAHAGGLIDSQSKRRLHATL
jgi:hypothetical protein